MAAWPSRYLIFRTCHCPVKGLCSRYCGKHALTRLTGSETSCLTKTTIETCRWTNRRGTSSTKSTSFLSCEVSECLHHNPRRTISPRDDFILPAFYVVLWSRIISSGILPSASGAAARHATLAFRLDRSSRILDRSEFVRITGSCSPRPLQQPPLPGSPTTLRQTSVIRVAYF